MVVPLSRPAVAARGLVCEFGPVRAVDDLSFEVAAYYVVSEALANAAKHAQASVAQVHAQARDGRLQLWVRDDGVGGAEPGGGSGLVGLADRVDALGGTISVRSPVGQGTTLRIDLPIQDGPSS